MRSRAFGSACGWQDHQASAWTRIDRLCSGPHTRTVSRKREWPQQIGTRKTVHFGDIGRDVAAPPREISLVRLSSAERRFEAGQETPSWRVAGYTIFGMTNVLKIGHSREQVSLLPPCLEDYVDRDDPVRTIEAYSIRST